MTTRRDILKGGAGLAAILASGKAPAYLVKSMLAARNSIGMRVGGAKVPTAADYVQYGLVAMWDGIENAGFGLHDANATVWKDLIGSRDASLQGNFAWNSDNIHRASDSQTKILLPNIPVKQGIFIEYVIQLNNALTVNLRDFAAQSGSRFEIIENSNGRFGFFYINSLGLGVNRGGGEYVNSQKKSIYVGFSDGIYFSANGNPLGSDITPNTALSETAYGDGTTLTLGTYGTLSEDANWYAIRIYNRIPTNAQVAANYAVDKKRFNLP